MESATTGIEVDVLQAPERLAAVLPPIRRLLLENLREPDSASGLARRLGMPRQRINYHLRELERTGFVELDQELQRRGCVERMVRVTARAFVISHGFLEGLAAKPAQIADQFSGAYLITNAARTIREVALLTERAAQVDKKLATLSIEAEATFASPAAFREFSEELAGEIARLTVRYNQGGGAGRRFRVFAGVHPVLKKTSAEARREAAEFKKQQRSTDKRRRKTK